MELKIIYRDVAALHSKLDRVKGVETENENLQHQFLQRFQDRMKEIGDTMQLFQVNINGFNTE